MRLLISKEIVRPIEEANNNRRGDVNESSVNKNKTAASLMDFISTFVSSDSKSEIPPLEVLVDFKNISDVIDTTGYSDFLLGKIKLWKPNQKLKKADENYKNANTQEEIDDALEIIRLRDAIKNGERQVDLESLELLYEVTSNGRGYQFITLDILALPDGTDEYVPLDETPLIGQINKYLTDTYNLTKYNQTMDFKDCIDCNSAVKFQLNMSDADFIYFDPISLTISLVPNIMKKLAGTPEYFSNNALHKCFANYLRLIVNSYRELLLPKEGKQRSVENLYKQTRKYRDERLGMNTLSNNMDVLDRDLITYYSVGYLPLFPKSNDNNGSVVDVFTDYKERYLDKIRYLIQNNISERMREVSKQVTVECNSFIPLKMSKIRNILINYIVVMETLNCTFDSIDMIEFYKIVDKSKSI